MCYPEVATTDGARRMQALRARETLEAMQRDGVVRLIEVVETSGTRGVRVPVADAHRERHEFENDVAKRRSTSDA